MHFKSGTHSAFSIAGLLVCIFMLYGVDQLNAQDGIMDHHHQLDDQFCSAQLVFVGTASKVGAAELEVIELQQFGSHDTQMRIEFTAIEVFKGKADMPAAVYVIVDQDPTGYEFKKGETYLILAHRSSDPDIFFTDRSFLTQAWKTATASFRDSLELIRDRVPFIDTYVPKNFCFQYPKLGAPSSTSTFTSKQMSVLGDEASVSMIDPVKGEVGSCRVLVTYHNVQERTFDKMNERVAFAAMPLLGKGLEFHQDDERSGAISYIAKGITGDYRIRISPDNRTIEVCYPEPIPMVGR